MVLCADPILDKCADEDVGADDDVDPLLHKSVLAVDVPCHPGSG